MYEKMFKYVKEYLENNDGESCKIGNFPFRKRSEHIKRVFMWVKQKLMKEFTYQLSFDLGLNIL